jgi:hypothetical protein
VVLDRKEDLSDIWKFKKMLSSLKPIVAIALGDKKAMAARKSYKDLQMN